MNADLIAGLILSGLQTLQAMQTLQLKAKAEGRDITDDELRGLRDADLLVRGQLEAEIHRREGLT